jgi:hypothetical protein
VLQVKTNFTGFKVSAKRVTALISAAALSLLGLVATNTAANAASITKFSYASIQRQVTSDTFTLRANETIRGVVSASISSFSSDGVTAISSDHGITPLIPGVTYGQKSYQWTSNGCTPSMVLTATATPCGGATSIEVYVFQNVTNTTGSPITITANLSSAKFTYGSDEISATQENVSANKFLSGNDSMLTTGLVLTSDDTSVYGNIDACLDDTLYDVGDTLTWSSSASINGTVLADDYSFNSTYMYFRNGGNPLTSFEVAAGQMTNIYLSVQGGSINLTPGTLSISVDLKNDGVSVLKACPTGGGPVSGLFPVGGASVSGTFSLNSKITTTPNTWSLTSGGSAVTATSRFIWYVCDTPLSASTSDSMEIECFDNQPAQVLANGTSVGTTNGPNQGFTGSSLTITQSLLTALTGKHLMVIILGTAGTGPSSKYGQLFMKSCGPITSGSTCSSTFGTPAVAKKTPKAATVATKVKIGKTFIVALHASKGTASKGANADLLPTVVSVASSSKAFCSATKIVKSGKITGYTIKGLKAGKCSVVVTITGSSTFNASTKTTVVTVSK